MRSGFGKLLEIDVNRMNSSRQDSDVATPSSDATIPPAAPPGWVPAERRWWGFDRLSLRPALAVLAFVLVARTLLVGAPFALAVLARRLQRRG